MSLSSHFKRGTTTLKRMTTSMTTTFQVKPFRPPNEKEFVRDNEVSSLCAILYGVVIVCFGFIISIMSHDGNLSYSFLIKNYFAPIYYMTLQIFGIGFLLLTIKILRIEPEILPDMPHPTVMETIEPSESSEAEQHPKATNANTCVPVVGVDNPIYSINSLDDKNPSVYENLPSNNSRRPSINPKSFYTCLPYKYDVGFVKNAKNLGIREINSYFVLSSKEAESPSFFLKLAALILAAVGLISPFFKIIHSVLSKKKKESLVITLMEQFTLIVYTCLQTYTFFKYSNISLNFYLQFCKCGFLHLAATNVCLWLQKVITESFDEPCIVKKVVANVTDKYDCDSIYGMLSPYLYPFFIEYTIMAALFCYTMAGNVGKFLQLICQKTLNASIRSLSRRDQCKTEASITCYKSTTSVFLGCVILLMSIIAGLYHAIEPANPNNKADTKLSMIWVFTVMYIVNLFLIICMIIPLKDLPRKQHRTNGPDRILLRISLAVALLFKLNHILIKLEKPLLHIHIIIECLIASLQIGLQVFAIELAMTRNFVQTSVPMILRFSVTVLMPSNLGVWFFYTMVSTHLRNLSEINLESTNAVVARILGIICLPLLVFFHFHSVCCFADIWKRLGKKVKSLDNQNGNAKIPNIRYNTTVF